MAISMNVRDLITPSLKRIKKELAQVPKQAYDYWVSITPIRSGNARRRTKLTADTILADYAYAQRLDTGWSKQFGGRGMTKPTEQFVYKRVKQIMRKK